MKSAQEIREAIEAAKEREESLDVPEAGNPGGAGILAAMCQGNYEALLWVLEEDGGSVTGLKEDTERVVVTTGHPDREVDADRIIVQCPDCGHEFETHDVGDLVACEDCDEQFNRFQNIVGEA